LHLLLSLDAAKSVYRAPNAGLGSVVLGVYSHQTKTWAMMGKGTNDLVYVYAIKYAGIKPVHRFLYFGLSPQTLW
jgi:hypothetical protein